MPDYGIAAQIKPPQSAFSQLGEMLNVARGATALERERGTLLSDIERAKAESSRAVTESGVAAQTATPRVEAQKAATATAQTGAVSSQWKLDAEQAAKAYEIAAGVAQDPAVVQGDSAGSMQALMRAEEQMRAHKIPEDKIRAQTAPLYMIATHKPEQLRQALDNIVRSGSGVSAQAGVINAPVQMLNTGAELKPVQLQPGAQGGMQAGTAPIPQQLPLAQRQEVSANPITGNPQTTTKDAQGNVVGVAATPTAATVPLLNPGQREDIPILTNLRSAVNSAAAQAPESRFHNSQILKLVDETDTGRRAELVRTLKGPLAGIPWETQGATKFDQLGHFIARETAANSKAMNAGTDAARGLAEQANASTGWTPQAIKSAVKINDAFATGLQNYNKGMEAAIQRNGGNVLAVRPFQNAWSQAFDPNIYRFANAMESGDKAEITKILGPEGSKERATKAAELARKSATLFRLSTEGQ